MQALEPGAGQRALHHALGPLVVEHGRHDCGRSSTRAPASRARAMTIASNRTRAARPSSGERVAGEAAAARRRAASRAASRSGASATRPARRRRRPARAPPRRAYCIISARSCSAKNFSAVAVLVCCAPVRSTPRPVEERARLGGDLEHLRRRALGRQLEDPRRRRGTATARRPSCGRSSSGANLQLEHEDRAEHRRARRARCRRARAASKNARCSFENSLRIERSPGRRASRTSVAEPRPSSTPSTRSRRASRRPRRPTSGERRSCSGSSPGTTGRSLTTESSPRPWTRRARTTTPVPLSVRSGVSKKHDQPDLGLQRVHARGRGSSSAAGYSGTVSFSSTESLSRASVEHLAEVVATSTGSCRAPRPEARRRVRTARSLNATKTMNARGSSATARTGWRA